MTWHKMITIVMKYSNKRSIPHMSRNSPDIASGFLLILWYNITICKPSVVSGPAYNKPTMVMLMDCNILRTLQHCTLCCCLMSHEIYLCGCRTGEKVQE